MDAASILLAFAMAGQAAWTPERYTSPPPAAAPIYDRYAQPPARTTPVVAPPPGVVDRARSAVTETGNTLRDGFEAGIKAANEQLSRGGEQMLDATRDASQEFGQQLQGWTNDAGRQLDATGNSLRAAAEPSLGASGSSTQPVSNPFGTTSATPPAANPRTRGNVAPPPWPGSATTTAPSWSAESTTGDAGFTNAAAPQGMVPVRTESGWTSIGSNVAAPPLLVPRLTTATANTPPARIAAGDKGPNFPRAPSDSVPLHSALSDEARQTPSPSSPADDWATGWSNNSAPTQATIGRAVNIDSPQGNTASDRDLAPVQPANTRPQNTQQQAAGDWADIWGDTDPWAQPAQTAPVVTIDQRPPVNGSIPLVNPQLTGAPANTVTVPAPSAGTLQTAGISPAGQNAPPVGAPTTNEPPWMPLLVVSVSLAGSLGANLFLGWSYMDARQKYRALVRKTADKFRRVGASAA